MSGKTIQIDHQAVTAAMLLAEHYKTIEAMRALLPDEAQQYDAVRYCEALVADAAVKAIVSG